jgi:hypothetical protein
MKVYKNNFPSSVYGTSLNKSLWDVICNKCTASFSVAHSGKHEILHHIKSEKHKSCVQQEASSSKVTDFFSCKEFGNSQHKLAAAEGTFAYHTIRHNHSYRSTDCTSKLIKDMFNPKYASGRTKTEAIVTNVLFPFVSQELTECLATAKCTSVFIDSSNHKEIKIIPILVKYFSYIIY